MVGSFYLSIGNQAARCKQWASPHQGLASLLCRDMMQFMASPEKKIREGGWNKTEYKHVRSKINKLALEGDSPVVRHRKISLKKPKTCRGSTKHEYVLKDSYMGSWFQSETFECTKCGKKKYTSKTTK